MTFPPIGPRPPGKPATSAEERTPDGHRTDRPAPPDASGPPGWLEGVPPKAGTSAPVVRNDAFGLPDDAASGAAAGAPDQLARQRVATIQARINRYQSDFGMVRDTGRIRGSQTTYVEDEFPEDHDFEHEGKKTKTHFLNHFHVDSSGPDKVVTRIVALENYKSPALDFFASDVLLVQLAAATVPASRKKSIC